MADIRAVAEAVTNILETIDCKYQNIASSDSYTINKEGRQQILLQHGLTNMEQHLI
jgi:hypothetical protein